MMDKYIDTADPNVYGPERMGDLLGNVKHICGPEEIKYGENELIALCVVRDGRVYIRSFIEHYLAMGFKHIVLLDNNSIDDTIEIAKPYENITVLQTTLPFKHYKFLMKQFLIRRFGEHRWSLCADIDELFDFPFSDILTLHEFIEYLNANSFTAVVAYMLDMFSDEPLDEMAHADEDLKNIYHYYDITGIQKLNFEEFCPHNKITNPRIANYRGGIRDTLFNTYDRLTKTPLIFCDGKIKPMWYSSHKVKSALIADISVVLYHYKFADDFIKFVKRVVREENYYKNSEKYKQYLEVLEEDPKLSIMRETARELTSVNDLIENQFLAISKKFVDWIKKKYPGMIPIHKGL